MGIYCFYGAGGYRFPGSSIDNPQALNILESSENCLRLDIVHYPPFRLLMRKRSSKHRSSRRKVRTLSADVISPRIAWFAFLGILGKTLKLAALVLVLCAAGFGIHLAIQKTFRENPDFRLQAIQLNENSVFDEVGLAEALSLDLSGNIFGFDLHTLERKLLEYPAISEAKISRVLPGTLDVKLKTREPIAWIAGPSTANELERVAGALVIDKDNFAYPCPPGQLGLASSLPFILLSEMPKDGIQESTVLDSPGLNHCRHLLDAISEKFPGDLASIESISQKNKWSLNLETRDGTQATFGLGDHQRQLEYLRKGLYHAHREGYEIDTINLIPRQNVPITLRGDPAPPRAIVVQEITPAEARRNRTRDDLQNLLNRN